MTSEQLYKQRWDQLRGIYRSLIWLPMLALAILLLLALGLNAVAGLPFFIGWVVFIVRYAMFRCPRCEKPFWWTWLYRNPFTGHCVHCQLPKWSLEDTKQKVMPEVWPRTKCEIVRAYAYNPENSRDLLIARNGVLHPHAHESQSVLLTPEQIKTLHQSFGLPTANYPIMMCFSPRHGIVYFNSNGVPVASLTICFECNTKHIEPNDTEVGYLDFHRLHQLFQEINLIAEH